MKHNTLIAVILIPFAATVHHSDASYQTLIDSEDIETSSSKNLVKRFNSPASVSVLTASKIKKQGVTSIAEALRLVPGVIVREQVNGQFDVSIRGFENAPRNEFLSANNSRSVLLMIDERPIFDYFQGGIFWETLPISIDDIDKIEVVRGAVSSMYGPNAALGVIHIKTKRPDSDKTETKITASLGDYGYRKAHVDVSGKNSFFTWRASGISLTKDRYETTYYNVGANEYQTLKELKPSRGLAAYPNPERAQSNKALSLSLYNEPERLVSYDITAYYQQSEVQKAYISSLTTPITTNKASSHALNIKLNAFDWNVRLSRHKGKQETIGFDELEYDFITTQSLVEYEFKGAQWFIRPGIRYDQMQYDSELVQGQRTLRNTAFYTRSEYNSTKDFKLTASASVDQYSFPKEKYLSYELGFAQKIGRSSLARVGIQRANRSSFMYNSFFDLDLQVQLDPNSPVIDRYIFKGDKDVGLVTFNTLELGWREQLSFYHALDVEVFFTRLDGYSNSLESPTSNVVNNIRTTEKYLEEVPTEAEQIGATLDWHYLNDQWDFNAFVTLQQTQVTDQIESIKKPINYNDENSKASPQWYGGANMSYKLGPAWQLASNIYFMGHNETRLLQSQNSYKQDFRALANVTLHYDVNAHTKATFGVKNLSNNQDSQYFYTEKIKPSVFLQITAGF